MAEWKDLSVIVESVKNIVGNLRDENRNVQVLCKTYTKLLDKEHGTPKECENIRQINEKLQKIEENLMEVLKKATDKVIIEFVGATSSGKSTLINALLREERLPVGFAETMMCLIEICTSNDDDWKVEVDGKLLSSGGKKEEVKGLLNAMICDDLRSERKNMGINEDSRVKVYWPAKFSPKVLPENVVLLDSPGFGEEARANKIVIDSCKKADIIVAVMDVMSPSISHVTELVTDVNCQYTFGVFTKWDVLEEKSKQQEGNAPNIDPKYLRKKTKKKFLKSVNNRCTGVPETTCCTGNDMATTCTGNDMATTCTGKDMAIRCTDNDIFFVDSQHVLKNPELHEAKEIEDNEKESHQEPEKKSWLSVNFPLWQAQRNGDNSRPEPTIPEESYDGVEEFLRFEKRLAKSAKEKKGEFLKTQVKSIVTKSKNVIDKFKSSVEERKKRKLERLEKTSASVKHGGKEFSKICNDAEGSILKDLEASFTHVKKKLIREFEVDVKNGNLSEEEALEKLCGLVNENLKATVTSIMEDANNKFKKWHDCMKPVFPFKESEMLIKESEIAQLKNEKLPKDRYNEYADAHYYLTSNYLWAAGLFTFLLSGGGVVASVATTVAATALEGGIVGGVASALTSGAAGGLGAWYLRIGDMIKRHHPISAKKLQSLKDFLLEKCEEAHEVSNKVIKGEIDRISKETGDEVRHVETNTQKEITELHSSSHMLNKLPKDLEDGRKKVEEIFEYINTLH